MDPKDLVKQIIDLQKATFDMTFGAVSKLPEQGEKLLSGLLDKADFLPNDSKKTFVNWIDSYKKSQDDFKKTVESTLKTTLNPKDLAKQLINLQKATFDTTFSAINSFQAHSEQLIQRLLDRSGLTSEGRKVFDTWITAYKNGQDEFRRVVEEGFGLAFNYFNSAEEGKKKEENITDKKIS
ncbi:MAG: polyhydroxyalkanoate synthesis regulator phasin [bacterium]|jgi:polyhydroxyalkanoate synthesis regulator phasin